MSGVGMDKGHAVSTADVKEASKVVEARERAKSLQEIPPAPPASQSWAIPILGIIAVVAILMAGVLSYLDAGTSAQALAISIAQTSVVAIAAVLKPKS